MVVFDKAYNYYHQFSLWTQSEVYFVTRMRKNAAYVDKETMRSHYRKHGQAINSSAAIDRYPENSTG
jgi:hypothetical protein